MLTTTARTLTILLLATSTAFAQGAASTRAMYPQSPQMVVEAYCQQDLDGGQTSSDTWNNVAQFTVWPDAPGWDTFTIVSGYTVGPVRQYRNSAKIHVTYTVLGVLEGETAKAESRTKTVVYTVVKRGGKWKVAKPQLEPHVSPAVAMRILDGLEHSEYVGSVENVRASKEVVRKMQ